MSTGASPLSATVSSWTAASPSAAVYIHPPHGTENCQKLGLQGARCTLGTVGTFEGRGTKTDDKGYCNVPVQCILVLQKVRLCSTFSESERYF